jgi:RNA polymerase sigma-54 factor
MSGFGGRLYQGTELRQEMKINPRLYQAMELLHMPLLDLQQHLNQEMIENPFLELLESESEREISLEDAMPEQTPEADDAIDWEKVLLEGFEPVGRRPDRDDREFRDAVSVEAPDLRDHLLEQLHHLPLSERETRLGEEVVGNIDDGGLLVCPLEEVTEGINRWLDEVRVIALERAEVIEVPEEREAELCEIASLFCRYSLTEAESMLEVIQKMDPPGVGARTLNESILLQLSRREEDGELPFLLVRDHFDDFLNHRWNEVARKLGVSPAEVQDAADRVARLDPKPGLRYGPQEDPYVLPDLIVEKIAGAYHVFLNDSSLPRLRLSRSYMDIARDRSSFQGENRDFISAKLNSANWMIQAIEQRRQTMIKVMSFIVDRQRDFFEKGIQHLRPLTLKEVADYIEMHESTVSRVTNEKYVQTPRGLFSLKFFFSSGLATASGEDISARGVKDKIRNLVQQENSQSPLTDQRIVDLLESDGVWIARRTVAKYREQLGVLPARMRKRV